MTKKKGDDIIYQKNKDDKINSCPHNFATYPYPSQAASVFVL